MCKAVAHLFAGEMNAKRFRIALDEIAGLPKKHLRQLQQNPNATPQSQTPKISELILDAATKHLSEDALYRSPEESYEMLLSEELHAERLQADTRILAASIRDAESLADLAVAGLDTFTFSPDVARQLFDEPLTLSAAEEFEKAAARGSQTLAIIYASTLLLVNTLAAHDNIEFQ
ncbi:hypothetical protein THAOC_05573 [Thalassiosira oceanica]|uniref:Transaldolase n=1 Tax=Thalassiosira oceanica TaxID=159749 RepID=K0TGS2_THAOC|nr:hypothetical protein THAOC_05573 [Thalassiosira oceanica]|eukprot:EJK72856.1 hypothetical protein THAOC_05573 [Thalassiosira oceanica]